MRATTLARAQRDLAGLADRATRNRYQAPSLGPPLLCVLPSAHRAPGLSGRCRRLRVADQRFPVPTTVVTDTPGFERARRPAASR